MRFISQRFFFTASLLAVAFLTGSVLSQSQYPANLLNQKGNFSRGAATATGEPFTGLVTSAGKI